MTDRLTFDLQATCGDARAGVVHTDHGDIQTPIFMPVGTAGTVKAVHQHELVNDIEAQIILGNTYHLYLRPGCDILRQAGGLHKFNGWQRPILTDSGGFQVFSLAANRKLKEEGCTFRSHVDGSKHLFTPENVMDIQRAIGADIMMAFDECAPGDSDHRYAEKAMGLSLSVAIAAANGLAMVRVITGVSILYFLVPGYVIALALSFFVPPTFTGIAFDSGGVASGPLTATFMLPFAMGACAALGGNVMTDAFGLVAMVAMTPLITVQIMGAVFKLRSRRAESAPAPVGGMEIIELWEAE